MNYNTCTYIPVHIYLRAYLFKKITMNFSRVEFSNGLHSVMSIGDKIFFSMANYRPTDVFTLRLVDNDTVVDSFACIWGDGGPLSHYRSNTYSYTSTKSTHGLRMHKRAPSDIEFYIEIYDAEAEPYRQRVFDVIFTS